MVIKKRYSRLNPAYLAQRHAGMLFLCVALGVFAGIVWRSFIQTTLYRSHASTGVEVMPAEQAAIFDWDDKQREWTNLLHDPREWGMLHSNLRHAVKLAVTRHSDLNPTELFTRLAMFDPLDTVSASLFSNPVAAYFGRTLEADRRTLAENMDFQTLAAIVADLDPPASAPQGWDFSFFSTPWPDGGEAGIIARPGPDDAYFKVFYTLHTLLNNGREAVSPAAAWRTAVDEVTERLEREALFAGGGGFGPRAGRELLREISAMPVLAANSLYYGNGWFRMDNEDDAAEWTAPWAETWSGRTEISLTRTGTASGRVAVNIAMDLHPIGFPRDTAATRLPPVASAVLIAYLAAHEALPHPGQTAFTPAAPLPAAASAVPVEHTTVEPDSTPTYRTVIDEQANALRLARITELEEALRLTVRDRNASLRALATARESENRLALEAVGAQARADRFQERHDDAAARLEEMRPAPAVSAETAALLASRDAILRRLSELLTYCTEEHPFVRQARRELESAEALLALHVPAVQQEDGTAALAARVAALSLEWETAAHAAAGLEERRRRQAESVACLLEEAESIECLVSERESELAEALRVPIPMIRVETAAPATSQPPQDAREALAETPAASMPVAVKAPWLAFTAMPSSIVLEQTPPGWGALWRGLLGGLLLGALCMAARELLSRTFRNADEAQRMVKLPVLAALPAYDAASFRAAADTVRGDVVGTRPLALQFIPTSVELFEPAAEARRGRIAPAARRRRLWPWVAGLCLLLVACAVQVRSRAGFAQPRFAFGRELPLPYVSVPAARTAGRAAGGNTP